MLIHSYIYIYIHIYIHMYICICRMYTYIPQGLLSARTVGARLSSRDRQKKIGVAQYYTKEMHTYSYTQRVQRGVSNTSRFGILYYCTQRVVPMVDRKPNSFFSKISRFRNPHSADDSTFRCILAPLILWKLSYGLYTLATGPSF